MNIWVLYIVFTILFAIFYGLGYFIYEDMKFDGFSEYVLLFFSITLPVFRCFIAIIIFMQLYNYSEIKDNALTRFLSKKFNKK